MKNNIRALQRIKEDGKIEYTTAGAGSSISLNLDNESVENAMLKGEDMSNDSLMVFADDIGVDKIRLIEEWAEKDNEDLEHHAQGYIILSNEIYEAKTFMVDSIWLIKKFYKHVSYEFKSSKQPHSSLVKYNFESKKRPSFKEILKEQEKNNFI